MLQLLSNAREEDETRDGFFVSESDGEDYFLARKATQEEVIFSLISRLDAEEKLPWHRRYEYSSDSYPVYEAELPQRDGWTVLIDARPSQEGLRVYLHVRKEKDRREIVCMPAMAPQEMLHSLYKRILKREGYPYSLNHDWFPKYKEPVVCIEAKKGIILMLQGA